MNLRQSYWQTHLHRQAHLFLLREDDAQKHSSRMGQDMLKTAELSANHSGAPKGVIAIGKFANAELCPGMACFEQN